MKFTESITKSSTWGLGAIVGLSVLGIVIVTQVVSAMVSSTSTPDSET